MIFKKISGLINTVPLSTYEELISLYVDKVKGVKGVVSIIQMGSFTAPGLSDIDIIVIVDEYNLPKWEEISIKKLLVEENGFEVIAHDVFAYPKYLAKYIEGLFYLDRKKVLFGKEIGGYLSSEMIDKLKLILSFEYTVNRLEILVTMTSLPDISIRDILLYISTLRHTYILLNSFDIISDKECNSRIVEIENLRKYSLDNNDYEFKNDLNNWIVPSYKAVYNSVLLLGIKLNYEPLPKRRKWILNYKKLIFDIDKVEEAVKFFVKNDTFNKKFKGRILVEAMPSLIHDHIGKYKNLVKNEVQEFDKLDAINLRYSLAIKHKEFIKSTNYPLAKSYIIIENELPRLQDTIKKLFLRIISTLRILK